jgi:multidrug efflux pump subunit AcrA (membrane-fusion protein)
MRWNFHRQCSAPKLATIGHNVCARASYSRRKIVSIDPQYRGHLNRWLGYVGAAAGAAIAPGNLVVQSNVKAVRHPTGGVVAEIAAHKGQKVSSGDLLVRLDATQAQASLQVITKQLDEIRARVARLVAERDGLIQIAIPAELKNRAGEDAVKTLIMSEESLFRARDNAGRSQIDVFQSRIAQLDEQIAGPTPRAKPKPSIPTISNGIAIWLDCSPRSGDLVSGDLVSSDLA